MLSRSLFEARNDTRSLLYVAVACKIQTSFGSGPCAPVSVIIARVALQPEC